MNSGNVPLRTKVLKSFLWLSTGTFAGQLVSWVSTILVIRLLAPSDYGLMAMGSSFIALLSMLSELGISAAIIQTEHLKDEDIRKIFGLVLITNLAGCAISILASPYVAAFFNEPKLVPLIRLLSLNFVIISLYLVPQSLFIREMDFRKKAHIDILSQVGASAVTLVLAFLGMGVWALATGVLSIHAIKALGFNMARPAWVSPSFRFKDTEALTKFGITVAGSRILYYVYMEADKVIIGKFLGNEILGIYAVSLNLASMAVEKVVPIIIQITFSAYSRAQNDVAWIRRNLLRTAHIIAFLSFPVFLGMAAIAPEAIPLILGARWATIVVPFQFLCLVMPLKALNSILSPAVFAIGKPKVDLVNMAITSASMAGALLVGVQAGLMGICIAWVTAYPVIFCVTCVMYLRALTLPFTDYAAELAFPAGASVLTMGAVLLVKRTVNSALAPLPSLILIIISAILVYLALVVIFKRDEYSKLRDLLKTNSA
ncbi:MAG TPA: lipopolysaccharide biosynthesis protein [Thermodesulfobacteriota bacterium]|nr:lipopolysaccharide biosynthesis protein [Thermodesulfobacteriota bacterium]